VFRHHINVMAQLAIASKGKDLFKWKSGLSYGQGGGRPPPCHSRTVRDTFASHGSSVERSLSLTPFRVSNIVTVGVQQNEVSRVIVGMVAVPMMHFQHVLCREA